MNRVALLSEVYNPEQAIDAGFVDEVVDAGDLTARTEAIAAELAQLPQQQFAANKLAIRADSLRLMKDYLAESGQG
jgi:enoyl-CoA hydratase